MDEAIERARSAGAEILGEDDGTAIATVLTGDGIDRSLGREVERD